MGEKIMKNYIELLTPRVDNLPNYIDAASSEI